MSAAATPLPLPSAAVRRALDAAGAALAAGRLLEAQRRFYRARDLSGRDPEVMRGIANRWRLAGWSAAMKDKDPESASTMFHNARAIYASLGGDARLWETVRGLAIAAGMLGEQEAALRLCEEAERQAPDDLARAKVCNTRGVACSYLGRFAESRRWAERALSLAGDEAVAATARQTIGIALICEGRAREALGMLKDPVLAALAHLEAGDPRRALAVAPETRPRAFAVRARAWLALGKRGRALAELRAGARVIEAGRGQRESDEARAAFAGQGQEVHALLVRLCADAGRWAEAFRAAEAARARAFLDFAAAARPRDLSHLRASERGRFEQLRARIEALQKSAGDGAELSRLEDEQRLALRRYEQERLAAARVLPRRPLAAARVRRALGPGEALVQYQIAGDALLAFVFTRDRFTPLRLPASAAEVLGAARDLPRALALARRDERAGGGGFAAWHYGFLGEALLAPLPLDGVARLAVVPHGELHLVPFAALRVRGGDAVERLAVTAAPSASVYATLRGRRREFDARRARCLLVEDPTGTLEHAAAEAAALRRVFGRRLTVLAGAAASRAAVLRLAPRHDVVHVATHAVWRPDRPDLSYLELAGGERLTASDLLALDLGGVRAAVLSACDSGRGDFARAEELFGLPRALLRAGAGTVLATLWPIEDHAAIGEVMAAFYEEGLSAAAAQRRARRAGVAGSLWGGWVQYGV